MKRETARLLRAVLRLIETDVRELSDTVVEIDEREAEHSASLRTRLDAIEHELGEHVTTYAPFAHPPHPVPEGFSVKAS